MPTEWLEWGLRLAAPMLDPASRTYWLFLLSSLGFAGLYGVIRGRPVLGELLPEGVLGHPSAHLDLKLLISRQLLAGLVAAPIWTTSWYWATHLARWLSNVIGASGLEQTSSVVSSIVYTAAIFLAWDASRWFLHWLLHRVPLLWRFHQVHHSAEVLTPFTLHRVHPLESVLSTARDALVTGSVGGFFYWLFGGNAVVYTVFGVHLVGLIMNFTHGNLRHTHLWLAFPHPVERWWLSPAQHQLHHSANAQEQQTNYGTWLSVWDRMAGTLALSRSLPPERFGVDASERNHGDGLWSAWWGPFRG